MQGMLGSILTTPTPCFPPLVHTHAFSQLSNHRTTLGAAEGDFSGVIEVPNQWTLR